MIAYERPQTAINTPFMRGSLAQLCIARTSYVRRVRPSVCHTLVLSQDKWYHLVFTSR